jgi:hypothetical protein
MGENKNSKRRYTGCACRCGNPTYATYLPGHDAKHVSKMVSMVILTEDESPWARGQLWQSALRQLPTDALKAKFRAAMYRSAQRHLGYAIDQMDDHGWQVASHLLSILTRDDEFFTRNNGFSPRVLATYAAALGWTRHRVNMKNS